MHKKRSERQSGYWVRGDKLYGINVVCTVRAVKGQCRGIIYHILRQALAVYREVYTVEYNRLTFATHDMPFTSQTRRRQFRFQ